MKKELAFIACTALAFGCSDRSSGGTENASGTGGSVAGHGGTGAGGTQTGGSDALDETTVVTTTEPPARAEERAAIEEELSAVAELDAAALLDRYRTSFEPAPTYETSAVAGLDTIQASPLALSGTELAALGEKGFVVTRRAFPTFAYGYSTIYMADLPVYISADSILESVHRSYDRVLQTLEQQSLIGELAMLLAGMRSRLAVGVGSELGTTVRADVDTYVAIAQSLLAGRVEAPVAGGSADVIRGFVSGANKASGLQSVTLFGVPRDEDFSQFKPRGHYTDSEELKRYFRAMMWLGRIDFRLFETQSGGSQLFRRRQLEGALLLHALVDADSLVHFERIDRAIRVFVGEPDYMQLGEVSSLLSSVGVSSLADVAGVSDQTFAQAIVDGGYGLQRISSHVMMNGIGQGTLPLSVSFAFLGQRYVIDSEVFSNVVYDRVPSEPYRMMPSPLDVAFAALGNDQAAALLAPELERYGYAPDLGAMRVLADRHPPEFWNDTLYNLWLGSLRELSPAAIAASADAAALPPTFRSEAWGRRLLNTELASWAELRHNTLLYVKQSYTSGAVCEFPDGYVEPYPEFFEKIAHYATRGKEAAVGVLADTTLGSAVGTYFDNLAGIALRLRDMAAYQRTGAPYTQEMLDFLNDAVVIQQGCADPYFASGWYRDLFFNAEDGITFAPTIADVHTQPTDEGGNLVGRVLHVGTGDARLMVVVAETCSGPRAYAGLASSYYEHVTGGFARLDDPTWETMVRDEPDVPWMADLVTER
jgi:Protein of unknown function (DUF3160)